jgi:hypothetical protein
MGDNSRPITAQDLENEARRAQECLSRARLLCVNIRNAGRFLGRELDSDTFVEQTFETCLSLRQKCEECRDKPSAIDFVRFANAGTSHPVRFNDWTVAIAHEAACRVLQDAILNYDPIFCWDERGERRGHPCTEVEKLQDCRRLVEWAGRVTDEFVEDIDVRIGMEHIVALKWLDSKAPEKSCSAKRYTPKELRKLFEISQNTLLNRLNKQQIRNIKHGSKSYQIYKVDLPDEEN